MNNYQDVLRSVAIKILVFFPILALIINLFAWLQYGIDLPFFDDWRAYATQQAGSLKWAHLFQPYNDTLVPLGNLLNALAERFLNGNTIAYQALSMVIMLGLLLLLQWRLLVLALPNRLLAACAFSLTLFMLMPGSYWGLQNEAYVQGLPLIFILSAIYFVLGKNWSPLQSNVTVFVFGALAGLSYISGAFAVLVLGCVFLMVSRFIQPLERRLLVQGGLTLFAAALVTVLPQIWVITVIQKGLHISEATIALPTESVFWMYLLGKIGRALIPVPIFPLFSFCLVVGVVLLATWVFFFFMRGFIQNKLCTLQEARAAIIYIALLGVISVYLLMLATARAHTIPAELNTTWLAPFTYGFHRIHYFWVTLLWPWLATAIFVITIEKGFFLSRKVANYGLMIWILISITLTAAIGIGNKLVYQVYTNAFYTKHVSCMLSELQKGRGINCPTLYPGDLSRAFAYARQIGASFTRYFPLLPLSMDNDLSKPIYQQSKIIKVSEFSFKTSKLTSLKTCMVLEVSALLRIDKPETLHLIYTIPAKSGKFKTLAIKPTFIFPKTKDTKEVIFQADGHSGFLDKFEISSLSQSQGLDSIIKFRDVFQLGNTAASQAFELQKMVIRCRLSASEMDKTSK